MNQLAINNQNNIIKKIYKFLMKQSETLSIGYAIGFLISKNILLTCAHAVINRNTAKLYQKITFILDGQDYFPIRYYYPQQYVESCKNQNHKTHILSDFAVLQLDKDVDLSTRYGYFGLYGKELDQNISNYLQLLGFLKDQQNKSQKQKKQKKQGKQILKKNELKHIKTKFVKSSYGDVVGYYANTLHGFSGSPGFIMYQDNPFVISIHTSRFHKNNFTQQNIPKGLLDFISRHIAQLEKENNSNIRKQKQIYKLRSFLKYKKLSNPIILGTYIGEQVKKCLNQWIDTKKLNLTNYQSDDITTLINIISKQNDGKLYKIKHLIPKQLCYFIQDKKNLKSTDIKVILQQCKNLFFTTALELQGNNLKDQFKLLPKLKYFSHLEHLNLNDTGITNDDIQLLKQLKYLGKLQIAKHGGLMVNEINDQTLKIFQAEKSFKLLKQLDISNNK